MVFLSSEPRLQIGLKPSLSFFHDIICGLILFSHPLSIAWQLISFRPQLVLQQKMTCSMFNPKRKCKYSANHLSNQYLQWKPHHYNSVAVKGLVEIQNKFVISISIHHRFPFALMKFFNRFQTNSQSDGKKNFSSKTALNYHNPLLFTLHSLFYFELRRWKSQTISPFPQFSIVQCSNEFILRFQFSIYFHF